MPSDLFLNTPLANRISGEHDYLLYARSGKLIKLVQAAAGVSDASRAKFERVCAKHQAWKIISNCFGVYNCFGMVFASRRAAIYKESKVRSILAEDGYKRRQDPSNAQPGDIVLYETCGDKGEIIHAGIFVWRERLAGAADSGDGIIRVLSKVDDVCGEVLHAVEDIEWADNNYSASFWTNKEND